MCALVPLKNGLEVAAVKERHIQNIIDLAPICEGLNKIVLFGSSLESRCREESDIDIAVFSDISEAKFLSSKSFRAFIRAVYALDLDQSYDILYFKSGKKYKDAIMKDIDRGGVLYEKVR